MPTETRISTIEEGQNIWDVAVQMGGGVEAVWDMLAENPDLLPGLDADLSANDKVTLTVRTDTTPGEDDTAFQIREAFRRRGVRISTGKEPGFCPGGIGCWRITDDFIVQEGPFQFQKAGVLDGVNDYWSESYSADVDFATDAFSASMWVKRGRQITTGSQIDPLIAFGGFDTNNGSVEPGYELRIGWFSSGPAGSEILTRVASPNGVGLSGVVDSSARRLGMNSAAFNAIFPIGAWNHILWVVPTDRNAQRIYINGVEYPLVQVFGADITNHNIGVGSSVGPKPLNIGHRPTGLSLIPFNGQLDEIAIYGEEKDLTAAQTLYNGGAGQHATALPALVRNWKFNEFVSAEDISDSVTGAIATGFGAPTLTDH